MEGVRLEFRKLGRDLRWDGNWHRRLGTRALPAAALAAVGAGGLCARKYVDPPDTEFLDKRATFRCGSPASSSLPTGAATEAALAQELPGGHEALNSLKRAARRLRWPVERDLMQVERKLATVSDSSTPLLRRQHYRELVPGWQAAGLFEEPLSSPQPKFRPGIDLVTQEDESYGRDIGSEVPLCLLREAGNEELHSLGVLEWEAAADALVKHGVVRLKDFVPVKQVDEVRSRLGLHPSAMDKKRKDAKGFAPVRLFDATSIQEEDPELEPVVSAPGRLHFYVRGRPLEHVLRGLQVGVLPLIWEHFARTTDLAPGWRPYVSEVQLLIAEPCAADQFWHVDNAHGGLSLFIPLTAVPEDVGATLFLPGTHHLLDTDCGRLRRVADCASSLLTSAGVPIGILEAGDALLYDARTFHRCAGNRRLDRTRVALVFRYDIERPPGIGIMGTQLVSWTGGMLSRFQRLYAALPGGAAPA